MLQAHEVEQIIQQLDTEEAEASSPYLGLFCDEHNPEYWYIKANRAGLHKYAADLLRASIANPDSVEGCLPDIPLDASWQDETGDAQPLFVRLADGQDPVSEAASNSGLDLSLQIGCWLAVLLLGGIFLAGIKEIVDLFRA